MREDLQAQLANDFPFMRRKASLQEQQAQGGITDLYSAFGCDVGDGWFDILHGLCSEITAAYQAAGEPIDIVVDQVKEKWGGLRYYAHYQNHPQTLHALDCFGGPSIRFKQGDSPLHKEIGDIISKWEKKSFTTCERCGKPGSPRKGRWIRTLCDSCYSTIQHNETPQHNNP